MRSAGGLLPRWAAGLLVALALCSQSQGVDAQATNTRPPPPLNITAIVGVSNLSVLQCWQFGPLTSVSAPGVTGASALLLGGAASQLSYTVFPPKTTGGLHHSPRLQFVVFLSGMARIKLPSDGGGNGTTFDVKGGRNGLIVAADTRDVSGLGHSTDYPGNEPTTVLQLPIAAGRFGFGRYSVLHQGACTEAEMSGL